MLSTLGCANRQLCGGRLLAGGLRHDPERLRLEHRAHLHADAGETLLLRLPVPAGHGLQLGDVRQRGRQRLRGRHRHLGTPSQGVWSTARLDFSVPPGGIAKLHFGAFGGIPGLVQSVGTLDLYMQIRASAFKGESVLVTDLLADSLALTGSATLDGLTAQGNVGCDQLCNDVNCTCSPRAWTPRAQRGRVRQLAEHQRRGVGLLSRQHHQQPRWATCPRAR